MPVPLLFPVDQRRHFPEANFDSLPDIVNKVFLAENVHRDRMANGEEQVRWGSLVVLTGGRTGRDGPELQTACERVPLDNIVSGQDGIGKIYRYTLTRYRPRKSSNRNELELAPPWYLRSHFSVSARVETG
jgi:hypothetical protein